MPTGRRTPSRRSTSRPATGGVLLSSMGNPQPLPGLLGQDADQRLPGDQPAPSIPLREPMETRVFLGKKPVSRPSGTRTGQLICRPAASAGAVDAGDVLRHELRLHQLQRPRQPCPRGAGAGYLLQHRRGRPARGFLPLRRQHHRAGGLRALRRAREIPEGRRGHRDQDGAGRQARHRRASARRQDRGRRVHAPA